MGAKAPSRWHQASLEVWHVLTELRWWQSKRTRVARLAGVQEAGAQGKPGPDVCKAGCGGQPSGERQGAGLRVLEWPWQERDGRSRGWRTFTGEPPPRRQFWWGGLNGEACKETQHGPCSPTAHNSSQDKFLCFYDFDITSQILKPRCYRATQIILLKWLDFFSYHSKKLECFFWYLGPYFHCLKYSFY